MDTEVSNLPGIELYIFAAHYNTEFFPLILVAGKQESIYIKLDDPTKTCMRKEVNQNPVY